MAASGRFLFITCGTEHVLDERQQSFQNLLDWTIRTKVYLDDPALLSFLCVPAPTVEAEGRQGTDVPEPCKQDALSLP
eukprot:CAMPEP_0203750492 /NCGR_PEP_ID=MMETSP0098-20131031/4712_1 /ASSEMBLY_ACC=CAM_ASM_000208 /TAXON_ID=96639 /ORGANISM=" , Strain NY0313808BC1" /LENGTH=77 /DNA_ID=CAMNT_0050639807 /DNA_START=515 /DNA_END=745 /DNA_ORIENTATION=+